MPLRDHFHPPDARWRSLHGGWAMVIVQRLRPLLPPGYVARPYVTIASGQEIDIASRRLDSAPPPRIETGGTALMATARPTVVGVADLAEFDAFEVLVHDAREGHRVVAAVEIVSPRNKDRRTARNDFVNKCAGLLREEVSVVIVDLVTSRNANLYAELLERLGLEDPALGDSPPGIYAAWLRPLERGRAAAVEAWSQPLAVGLPLPTLPLWLPEPQPVPLDLEASYAETCETLCLD